MTPAGSSSVTSTCVAVAVPPFVTVSVYVIEAPFRTGPVGWFALVNRDVGLGRDVVPAERQMTQPVVATVGLLWRVEVVVAGVAGRVIEEVAAAQSALGVDAVDREVRGPIHESRRAVVVGDRDGQMATRDLSVAGDRDPVIRTRAGHSRHSRTGCRRSRAGPRRPMGDRGSRRAELLGRRGCPPVRERGRSGGPGQGRPHAGGSGASVRSCLLLVAHEMWWSPRVCRPVGRHPTGRRGTRSIGQKSQSIRYQPPERSFASSRSRSKEGLLGHPTPGCDLTRGP